MPRIKRRNNRKKVVKRKVAPKSTDMHFTEDDLRNIPPHLLDKIPAGASMKPTAASIRNMAMQRFATPFIQMPQQTAQQQQVQNMKNENDVKQQALQQQVQNMKNENDVKQQALNQTAQDRIVEMDRKKNLVKQEHQQKLDQKNQENDLRMTQQELKQQRDLNDQKQKLELERKKYDYEKQLLDENSEIQQLKRDNENTLAAIAQIKFEIEKGKQAIEKNALASEKTRLEKEQEILTAQNTAIKETLTKMNSPELINEFKTLAANVAEQRMKAQLYESLKKMHEENLQTMINNMVQPTQEQIDQQINTIKPKIQEQQKEIATQLETKLKHEENQKLVNFFRDSLTQAKIDKERILLENNESTQRNNQFDQEKAKNDIKDLIKERVKTEIDTRILDQQIDEKTKEEQNLIENERKQAELNYIKSEDYAQKQKELATYSKAAQAADQLTKQHMDFIAANKKALEADSARHVSELMMQAALNNKDLYKSLFEIVDSEELKHPNKTVETENMKAAFQQIEAQAQSTNVANNRVTEIVNEFNKLRTERSLDGKVFRIMNKQIGDVWDHISSDTRSAELIWDQYKQRLEDAMKNPPPDEEDPINDPGVINIDDNDYLAN